MIKYVNKELLIYILWVVFGILYFDRHAAQFDELLMLEIVRSTEIKDLFSVLTSIEVQMPLNYIISYALSEVSGNELWVMRIPSLIFTLLTPIPLYFWAKDQLGKGPAAYVPLLWMFSYPTLYFYYSVRPYSSLVFFFVGFMYFLNLREPSYVNKVKLIILGTLMVLAHPVGLLIAAVSTAWLLIRSRSYRRRSYVTGVFLLIFLLPFSFVLSRLEHFLFFLSVRDIWTSLAQLYMSLGFVFSGYLFGVLFLLVSIYSFFKIDRYEFRRVSLSFFIFLSAFAIFVTVQMLSSLPVAPRHYIIFLPFISLAFTGLVFKSCKDKSTARIIHYIAVFCLILKSFLVEDLIQTPPNLDSSKLVATVYDYSAYNEKVISCGNCLRQYIIDERLECLSSMDHLNLERFKNYFVVVEYSHERNQCNDDALKADYISYREKKVKGAVIKYYVNRNYVE